MCFVASQPISPSHSAQRSYTFKSSSLDTTEGEALSSVELFVREDVSEI